MKEVKLSGLDHIYYKLLEERAGRNNANIVGNAQTCITSCEFSVLIEEIVLAHFGQDPSDEKDSERTKSKRKTSPTTLNSTESLEKAQPERKNTIAVSKLKTTPPGDRQET